MKPTVLNRRNPMDCNTLILTHRRPPPPRCATIGARRADVSRARPSSLPTRVKDVLTLVVNSKRAERRAYKQRSIARETKSMSLVARTLLALEIGHRDLPNRVCVDEGWAEAYDMIEKQGKAS